MEHFGSRIYSWAIIYSWTIQKSLFPYTNQDSILSHTRDNSKMFNITSKYFSFFNNKPIASSIAHIAKDFLTCYYCSYSALISSFPKLHMLIYYCFKFHDSSIIIAIPFSSHHFVRESILWTKSTLGVKLNYTTDGYNRYHNIFDRSQNGFRKNWCECFSVKNKCALKSVIDW